jgi:hypothetical protein
MGRYGDAVDRVSTSDFYKFQDGDNRLRFLSDPVAQNKTFENNPEPQTIFSWYVWDYANKKVAILSKGAGFLRNVDAMMDEWGEELPLKCDVNIKKTGVGLATKYNWVASPAKTGKDAVPENWSEGLKPLLEAVPHSIDISAFGQGDDPTLDMGGTDIDLGGDDPFAGIDTVEK